MLLKIFLIISCRFIWASFAWFQRWAFGGMDIGNQFTLFKYLEDLWRLIFLYFYATILLGGENTISALPVSFISLSLTYFLYYTLRSYSFTRDIEKQYEYSCMDTLVQLSKENLGNDSTNEPFIPWRKYSLYFAEFCDWLPLLGLFFYSDNARMANILSWLFVIRSLSHHLPDYVLSNQAYDSTELVPEYKTHRLFSSLRSLILLLSELLMILAIASRAAPSVYLNYLLYVPFVIFILFQLLPYLSGVRSSKRVITESLDFLITVISEIKDTFHTKTDKHNEQSLNFKFRTAIDKMQDLIQQPVCQTYTFLRENPEIAQDVDDKQSAWNEISYNPYWFKCDFSRKFQDTQYLLAGDKYVSHCLKILSAVEQEKASELKELDYSYWLERVEKDKKEIKASQNPIVVLITLGISGGSSIVAALSKFSLPDIIKKVLHLP